MFLDKTMVAQMNLLLSRLAMPVKVCDELGNILLPETKDKTVTIPREVTDYIGSPFVKEGKVYLRADCNPPLYIYIENDSVAAQDMSVLAGVLVSTLYRANMPKSGKEDALRRLLREEVENAELEAIANENHIDVERSRCALFLHLTNVDSETMLGLLNDVLPFGNGDVIIELDKHTLVLLKCVEENDSFDEIEELAQAIVGSIVSETAYQIFIGVGEPKKNLAAMGESYREAKRAIELGRLYRQDSFVYVYRRLLLERFLAEVPKEMGVRYNSMMFNRKSSRLFNEEMIHTIEKFFENSLNLSETARQLYIHRNTLVYRLDKVQRITGLDLRAFRDAVTFKMMMLLGKVATEKPRGIR